MEKLIREAQAKADSDIGTVNVLIAGHTGVGKSTLINEFFEGRFAETGQGEPVTKETRKITKEGVPLAIYDTRGLESKEFEEILGELRELVSKLDAKDDHRDHIHVAWICIVEDSRRVQTAEIELHEMLADYDIPTLGVITKARSDGGFKNKVRCLLPKTKNVVRVRAISEHLDDGVVLRPDGLERLAEATAELIPEGVERAFAAAQKAALDLKKKEARKVVQKATTAAAAVGAMPIPVADAVALVPIQIGMMVRISTIFGISPSQDLLRTLLATLAGTVGATLTGRAIVSGALKFIPGIGTIAGSVISSTTAAALTKMLGEIYINVLAKLCGAGREVPPSPDEVLREFKDNLSPG